MRFDLLKILMVDDNHHMRTLIGEILRAIGVKHLYDAADGAAALEVLRREDIDIVLTDPDVELDYSRVVHGEQRFTHHRPIRAGDRLVATTTIDAVRSMAGNDLLTTRVDVATEDGEAVCSATSMLVARGPGADLVRRDVRATFG